MKRSDNMKRRGDFHTHTTYSDGKFSVDELLEFAKGRVTHLAITDHDEIDGAIEAYSKAKDYGIELILGVEVSTYNKGESVHILGYYKDINDMVKIQDFLKTQTEKRRKRLVVIRNRLKEYYDIDLDIEGLLQRSCVTRGSIAHEMFRQGLITNVKEAFEKYIGHDCKAYVPVGHIETQAVINMLKESNAKVFLAHPVRFKHNTPYDIIPMGIDGMEARYSKNKSKDTRKYLRIARKEKLVVSAGSDFHLPDDYKHGDVGCVYLKGRELDRFLKFIKE